jgi:hypothetical protein
VLGYEATLCVRELLLPLELLRRFCHSSLKTKTSGMQLHPAKPFPAQIPLYLAFDA